MPTLRTVHREHHRKSISVGDETLHMFDLVEDGNPTVMNRLNGSSFPIPITGNYAWVPWPPRDSNAGEYHQPVLKQLILTMLYFC